MAPYQVIIPVVDSSAFLAILILASSLILFRLALFLIRLALEIIPG